MRLFLRTGAKQLELEIEREGARLVVRTPSGQRQIEIRQDGAASGVARLGDRMVRFGWLRNGSTWEIVRDGCPFTVEVRDMRTEQVERLKAAAPAGSAATVLAPIPGRIGRVLVAPGQSVRKGEPLLTLTAMKMQNEIGAPFDGVVEEVAVREGETVEKGRLVARPRPS